jgi:hypothetical protein
MENQNEALKQENNIKDGNVEPQIIISLSKFIILIILTLGLYGVWWSYKSWRFFQQKQSIDILPAFRGLFGIFFLIPLFNRIQRLAHSVGYKKSYSSVLLFIGFFVVNLLVYLPDPYWLMSLLSFIFLIPAFNAFNYARRNSLNLKVKEQDSFNARQIVLIVIGSIFWFLLIMGLIVNPTANY